MALAEEQFPDLTEVEKHVVREVARGKSVDLSDGDKARQDLEKARREWRDRQRVRAEVLRWLVTDARAQAEISSRGIDLSYALLESDLDFDYAKVGFPICLMHSRLAGVSMRYGTFGFVTLLGSMVDRFDATGSRIMSELTLGHGFKSSGFVALNGVEIEQDLDCAGGEMDSSSAPALAASFCRVKGSVKLSDGFKAVGGVELMRARIDGDLDCTNGHFTARPRQDSTEPVKGLYALALDGARIGGGVLLRRGFRSEGEVRLLGAEIRGQLSCRGGTFRGEKGHHTLTTEGAQIAGTLWLATAVDDTFKTSFEGSVHLVTTNALAVVWNHSAFGPSARGSADGLMYRRLDLLNEALVSQTPTKELCDQWIGFATRTGFYRQPYSQLASVLRGGGDDELADEIMVSMHRTRRKQLKGWALFKSGLFDLVLGYGYRPRHCMYALLILLGVGTLTFLVANHSGHIVKRPATIEQKGDPSPLARDVPFNALVYSAETLLPVPDLGQKRAWEMSPAPGVAGGLIQVYYYLHVILGPMLSALFSVGLTGLVRKQ